MPFREKFAWLSLISMAITFLPFVLYVDGKPALDAPMPNFAMMKLFAAVMLTQAAIIIIGQIWLRLANREDARAKPDERDRAIDRRSIRGAYYVMIFGMIMLMFMPFERQGGWRLVIAAALAITVAESTRCIIAIVSYRRGWND
ncbi:MAG: hypothetical protein JWP35_2827 [Caulobacter sp.]|nr:hypothetical protein [Caulobacter sp.]